MSQHLLSLIFHKEAIEQLMSHNPDKIVIRSALVEKRLDDGSPAGVVEVFADAIVDGHTVDTVGGCPDPPCKG